MKIVNLGIFVADTVFQADRMPRMGETVLGQGFFLGPGGKGSNQSVAAAMAGGDVSFLTRVGQDAFAAIAKDIWAKAGVKSLVIEDAESYTGAAFIFLEQGSGSNAVLVSPGAAGRITVADVEARAAEIGGAKVFVTQLEQPLEAAHRGLEIARAGGAITLFNPAPAQAVSDEMLALCDFVTPNETEAEILTGITVTDLESAKAAAESLRARGAGAVIITMGGQGAFYWDGALALHLPPMKAGEVKDTTGAGDAFNGGLSVALAEGLAIEAALRFATATASISVTRMGTAASMPSRAEIEALLNQA